MKSWSVVSLFRNVTVSWAKCSTAMRMLSPMSASSQSEADAGRRQAAPNSDRSAVGAPAGSTRQGAVVVELDGIHAAADRRHFRDGVTHCLQLVANAFGNCRLDLERIALGPDAGCLHRFLQAHAVIDQVDQCLHRA